MKKTLGVKVAFCVMFLFILFFSNKVLATNDGLTILRKNDTEYIIYLNANLDKEYEYALQIIRVTTKKVWITLELKKKVQKINM